MERLDDMLRKLITVNILMLSFAVLMFQGFTEPANAAAVSATVPYSSTPLADSDLDGFPNTGAWSDANHYTVDLENGAAAPYGTATVYFKHNGTDIYFRIDGKIDVPWASPTGQHFWIGFQINAAGVTGHHRSTGQDTIFFGETDSSYGTITYPLTPIDTNGGGRPPTKDASQNAIGMARYSGTSAPYDFTAEWKRKLNTGDTNDVSLLPNGSTAYSFYVTTDSDGGGSSGGTIDHSSVTTANTMTLAPVPPVPEFPFGIGILMMIVPAFAVVYVWRTRKKVVKP